MKNEELVAIINSVLVLPLSSATSDDLREYRMQIQNGTIETDDKNYVIALCNRLLAQEHLENKGTTQREMEVTRLECACGRLLQAREWFRVPTEVTCPRCSYVLTLTGREPNDYFECIKAARQFVENAGGEESNYRNAISCASIGLAMAPASLELRSIRAFAFCSLDDYTHAERDLYGVIEGGFQRSLEILPYNYLEKVIKYIGCIPLLQDAISRNHPDRFFLAKAIAKIGGDEARRSLESLLEYRGSSDRDVKLVKLAVALGLSHLASTYADLLPTLQRLGQELGCTSDINKCLAQYNVQPLPDTWDIVVDRLIPHIGYIAKDHPKPPLPNIGEFQNAIKQFSNEERAEAWQRFGGRSSAYAHNIDNLQRKCDLQALKEDPLHGFPLWGEMALNNREKLSKENVEFLYFTNEDRHATLEDRLKAIKIIEEVMGKLEFKA